MLPGEQRFSRSERRTVTLGVKLPARVQTLSIDHDNADWNIASLPSPSA
jgi:hypothetical protein